MKDLIISGIQFDIVWEDKKANFKKLESLLRDVPGDTDIILFPEMFTTGFTMNAANLAETMEGETVSWMRRIAREKNSVVAGSIIVKEGKNHFNRFIWVQPDSTVLFYDKKHLFSPGGERKYYGSGTKRVVIEYQGWKIFPSVCYDLRFPCWLKNDLDYDVLINVANWPAIRAKHWDTFLRSRAIENQAYAIGINRTGVDGRNIEYSGDSASYNYDGNTVIKAGNIETVVTAKFNKARLDKFRSRFPFLKDMD